MADNEEQIRLTVDDSQQAAGYDRANKRVDDHEKHVLQSQTRIDQAAQQGGRVMVTVTDRSRAAEERYLKALEKRAELAGKSGMDRLVTEREQIIRGMDGQTAAIGRVRAAYDKLMAAEGGGGKWQGFAQNVKNFIQNPLEAAGTAVEGFLLKLGPMGAVALAAGTVLAGIGLGAYKAAQYIKGLSIQLGNWAEEQLKMAARTGMTVPETQQFMGAAKLGGTDPGVFEAMMRGLSRVLNDTSKQGADARHSLAEFGVTLYDISGRSRPTSQLLLEIADRLNGIEDPMKRAATAQEIFKRTGIELLGILPDLRQNVERLRAMGFGISKEEAERLHEIGKTYELIDMVLERMRRQQKIAIAVMFDGDAKAYLDWLIQQGKNPAMQGAFGGFTPAPKTLEQQWAMVMRPPAAPGVPAFAFDYENVAHQRLGGYLQSGGQIKDRTEEAKKAYEDERAAVEALYGGSKQLAEDVVTKRISKVEELRKKYEGLKAAYEASTEGEKLLHEVAMAAHVKEADFLKVTLGWFDRIAASKMNEAQKAAAYREIERIYAKENADETKKLALEWNNLQLAAAKAHDAMLGRDEKTGFFMGIPEVAAGAKRLQEMGAGWGQAGTAIRGMDIAAEREAIGRRASAALALSGAAYGGNERGAIEQAYQIRKQLAEDLWNYEQEQAAKLPEAWKQAEAQRRGYLDYAKAIDTAEIDRMTQIAGLQKKQFDNLKQSFEGLFDALLTRSGSVLSAIGNIFKAAILTPIKEAVSSWMAGMMMPLFGGRGAQGAQGAPAGGGGGFSLGGLLGGLTGGGGAGGGLLGGGGAAGGGLFGGGWGGGTGNPYVFSAAPAGGGGASGWVSGPMGAMIPMAMLQKPGGGAGAGLLSSLKSGWGPLAMLGGLGLVGSGIKSGTGVSGTAQTMGGSIMAGMGFANMTGASPLWGATLGAGAGLAVNGLQRGGAAGMFETAAGGALIGLQFGGPIGAAIGAGVGLVAGALRWLFGGKKPEQKVRDKIKAFYQVDIKDQGVLKMIADICKQSFGGDYDLGIRSPQIAELVRLYAEVTNQTTKTMKDRPGMVSLSEIGSQLYMNPTYLSGGAYSYPSPLPTLGGGSLGGVAPGVQQSTGTQVFRFELDGKTVASVLVQGGRVISTTGLKSSQGRAGLRVAALAPGTTVA